MIREYKAVHEDNFLSSWLRKDVERKAEEMEELNRDSKEEECKSGKREFEEKKDRVAVVCTRLPSIALWKIPCLLFGISISRLMS